MPNAKRPSPKLSRRTRPAGSLTVSCGSMVGAGLEAHVVVGANNRRFAAGVEAVLKDHRLAARVHGAAHKANKLLGLACEHAPADNGQRTGGARAAAEFR